MVLGILKENEPEQRVSMTPDAVAGLLKMGFEKVVVEIDAGDSAFFSNEMYQKNGAEIATAAETIRQSDVILCIQPPSPNLFPHFSAGKILIGQFNPLTETDQVEAYCQLGITCFSLDLAPRSTRAQALDVLSSMATVAGYKAVLLAASSLPNFMPMFMTAAGTVKPAKVLILGAGVAGLQAISTARRLGAIVEAFDVRSAAKEEVLSLGAKFVEVPGAVENKAAGGYAIEQTDEFKAKQAQLIHEKASAADIIICTAQIPGRRAPILIKSETVRAMKAGAVIVDLAASTGGNCELTENAKTIRVGGVTIIGDSNLPSTMPRDASMLFGKNVVNFLKLIVIKSKLTLNFEDDIVAATCISHENQVVSERLKKVLQG